MMSMSELTVVVSTDTADLVYFLLFFFTSAIWVAAMVAGPGRRISSLPSAVYAAARRP
jgi:hypothetical protein